MPPTSQQTPLRVLLVDDSEDDATLIVNSLRRGGLSLVFERVDNGPAMTAQLEKERWDIVISDWSMPSFSGLGALEILKKSGADIPFIIVSGTVGEETAVSAMRAGARDWVLKDKLARLAPAIERELKEIAARTKNAETLRRSDELLRQAQKMEAIGSLAAGVAHDFNNLLSVILGHSEMMLADLNDADPMHESVDEIRAAAERAAELTRRLLTFSRQEVVQPTILSVNTVVTGVEKMLRRLIGEDIDLTILRATNLVSVKADAGQIEQVLLNLVVNARDAMPRGGKLTIETDNVVLDEHFAAEHPGVTPGPHAMVAVSDTGTGMDQATLSRIFEPFYTTKGPGRGTGLGLATTLGIVQQSGGTIWTYSELGHGTTFKIYLPRAKQENDSLATTPVLERPRAPRGTETILIVEDEESVRRLTRTILQRQGYRILEVPNGGEALLICESHRDPIHLLLTDVIMPRMSGKELADRLGVLRPDLKVLFMSGYTDGAIQHHGVLDPDVAFVQKPISPDALVRTVRRVLDAPARDASSPLKSAVA